MNIKEMVIGAGVGVVVAGILGYAFGLFEKEAQTYEAGQQAIEIERLKKVIEEEMLVTIGGEEVSMSVAISKLHTEVTANGAALKVLLED